MTEDVLEGSFLYVDYVKEEGMQYRKGGLLSAS